MGHFHLQQHFEGSDPSRDEKGATKEWCKKHGVKKEERKRASEVGTPAGPLETHEQSVCWEAEMGHRHKEVTLVCNRTVLSSTSSPVCVTWLVGKSKKGGNVF